MREAVRMGRRGVAWIVVAVVAVGCRSGLAFRADDRVAITAPSDRSVVTVPFEVAWEAADLPEGSRFAVLVDRTPPPPGEDLVWLSRHDPGCAAVDCTGADHLRLLRVQVTDASRVTLESVPRPVRPGRELHEVTVIVLDAAGRRDGEVAGTVTVEVDRGDR